MKKGFVVFMFLLAAAAVFGLDLETSIGYQTKFMHRGERLSDTAVLVPAVGVVGKNFELRAKSFYNMDRKESFRGEYMFAFKTDMKAFDMMVGFQHFNMLKAVKGDTNEFFVSAAWEKWGLKPSIKVAFDFQRGSGKFIELGFAKLLGSGKDAASLGVNFNYAIGNDLLGKTKDGNYVTGFYNAELMLKSTIVMGKHLKAHPFLAYSFPLTTESKFAIQQLSVKKEQNTLVGGVSVDLSF